jgi:pyrimidine operon attenuation protein/uracil phosphoribosyltransferase
VPQSAEARVVLDADDVGRAITRIAHEILETNHGSEGLLLLGIPRRGVPLAHRLAEAIEAAEGIPVPVGQLDITPYRDDLRKRPTLPMGRTRIPGTVDDRVVVLVDDVLYSGRTVNAALDALKDLGRPRIVRLAVLVDRGHRELPIRADHVGTTLTTKAAEMVDVHLAETDEVTEVVVR